MHIHGWAPWVLIAGLVMLPVAAAAQDEPAPPRVSVGVGVGVAFPFHGDFDFTPWAWDGDVRVALSSRVLLEGALGEWRHSRTTVTTNVPVTPPPGVIGRIEQMASHVQRAWQVNLLATGAAGRLRMSGGGGVGLLQHDRRTQTIASDCTPGASCGTFESSTSNVTGAVQGVGGVEARIADGLALFGQARLIVPVRDLGASDFRITAGVRWGR